MERVAMKYYGIGTGLFLGLLLANATQTSFADTEFTQLAEVAGIAQSGAEFGYDVDISGDVAIVGARSAGKAYIYELEASGWTLSQEISGDASGEFGRAVAIDGDWAVVGAYVSDQGFGDAGTATIFHKQKGQWIEHTLLTEGENAGTNHRFGHSVAIDGDVMVIGADGNNTAYVYYWDPKIGWILNPSPLKCSVDEGNFGQKVSITNNFIAVLQPDYCLEPCGFVYIYDLTNLLYSDTSILPNTYFGAPEPIIDFDIRSFAFDGTTIVVGDWNQNTQTGQALVAQYQYSDDDNAANDWSPPQILESSNGTAYDQFGLSVAVDGNTILVSAQDDHFSNNAGSAYVFVQDGGVWTETQQLVALDYANSDDFGYSISLSGTTALIGAPHDDGLASNAGSAYFFSSGPTLRACCTNNTCVISERADCGFFGGEWLASSQSCTDCTPTCLGDLDGDGEVKVIDLLILIGSWGVCP
jgi:hypothetical protein